MPAPPLFEERPAIVQLALGVGAPIVLGALCGWLLGVDKLAYTVTSLALLLGAFAAGYEHASADDASVRGLLAGLVFGCILLVVHYGLNVKAKASLPHPQGALVVVAGIASAIAAAIGGALRARRERKVAEAQRALSRSRVRSA